MQVGKYLITAKTPRAWTPYLILIYALFITILSSYYIANITHKNNQLRFLNRVTLFEDNIENKVSTYTALLLGGRGLFAAEFNISKDDYKKYVDSLELEKRYQGMQSIGVVKRFKQSETAAINQQYAIDIFPQTTNSEIYPIVYLEPLDERNKTALGFDMSSEVARRTAMEAARDTGIPTATTKINLVQRIDDTVLNGFIIYVPIYYSQRIPETVEQRQRELIGFVYSPFKVNEFMTAISGINNPSNINFSIYSGTEIDSENALYSSIETNGSYEPAYSTTRTIYIASQPWTIHYESTPQFEIYFEKYLAEFILLIGVIISFILFGLSRSQYKARSAVERSAIRVLQSEEALQVINQKMIRILESITDGFITFDKNWQCTYANQEIGKLLELDVKGMLGKDIWTLIPNIEDNEIGTFIKKAIKQSQPSGLETFYEPKNIWLSLRAYPSNEGITMYIQDITKRKNMERQKDEFIGIASHELKTPVTSIKAYTQVLYKRFMREGNAQAAHLLQKMDNQIDKLTSLISDLLDATKIESGKLRLFKEEFSVDTLIKDVVEEMQRTTEHHVITIHGEAKCKVYGDKDRISQVIVNLLSNAIKYSPEATEIDVEVISVKNNVQISVKDYGVGIPKKLQKNIFKRFFRVEGSRELTFPGLGLGLYISAEIIKRHKGIIWVESDTNKGSTFRFTLPCGTNKK